MKTFSNSIGIRIFGEYIYENHIEIEAIETCLHTRSYEEESQEMFRSCRSILHDVLQEETILGSNNFISFKDIPRTNSLIQN
jgi:hypothetical protein